MELTLGRLKTALAIALGVIVVLILFQFRGCDKPLDLSQSKAHMDSLQHDQANLTFSLTISRKNEAFLRSRDQMWKDSLKSERARNLVSVTRIIHPPPVVQLNQNQVDSTLSKRYKMDVHVTPPVVGSVMVSDLGVLDRALEYLPKAEKEVEHLQQAIAVKDSLIHDSIETDSLSQLLIVNLVDQIETQSGDITALKKENKKLTVWNKIWKTTTKVLVGVSVALGVVVAAQ